MVAQYVMMMDEQWECLPAEFQVVDLRWGVTENAFQENFTLVRGRWGVSRDAMDLPRIRYGLRILRACCFPHQPVLNQGP